VRLEESVAGAFVTVDDLVLAFRKETTKVVQVVITKRYYKFWSDDLTQAIYNPIGHIEAQ
jgi:hypothetical protein